MNAMLSAQLMRKAMEIGNPAGIRLVRRILSANTRDWLFRPDFRKDEYVSDPKSWQSIGTIVGDASTAEFTFF